jgi:hypothetical protein
MFVSISLQGWMPRSRSAVARLIVPQSSCGV